jgi:acyl-CoA synthetase (AMP-forming)/AMP-acid ligase II
LLFTQKLCDVALMLMLSLSRFIIVVLGAAGAAAVAVMVQRLLEGPYWSFYVIALMAAAACLAANVLLVRHYVSRRTGGWRTDEPVAGVQHWELTAGTAVVPKGVSAVFFVGCAFVLAIPFELARLALKAVGLI